MLPDDPGDCRRQNELMFVHTDLESPLHHILGGRLTIHGRSYHRALGARAPPISGVKLPKLEHVASNSASETGAKMHQNAQICKLN